MRRDELRAIDEGLARRERSTASLKPDNEARIVWADPLSPGPTDLVVLYLHGLTGSPLDADPTHRDVAEALRANMLLARLPGHGIDDDQAAAGLTADLFIEAAEAHLSIARRLGTQVVVLGTSLGASLSLILAARHPDAVAAIVLWSPGVRPHDPALLDAFCAFPDQVLRDPRPRSAAQNRYWSANIHRDAYRALRQLFAQHMHADTFGRVECPVFLGMFEGPRERDTTASVAAMEAMFDAIATPRSARVLMRYPNGAHCLASPIRSSAAAMVAADTLSFLHEVLRPLRERQHDRQRWSELRYFLGEAPALLAYLAACRDEGLAALSGMSGSAQAGEHMHALKGVCDGLGLTTMKREVEWARAQLADADVAERTRILASLHDAFEQDLRTLHDWAATGE